MCRNLRQAQAVFWTPFCGDEDLVKSLNFDLWMVKVFFYDFFTTFTTGWYSICVFQSPGA